MGLIPVGFAGLSISFDQTFQGFYGVHGGHDPLPAHVPVGLLAMDVAIEQDPSALQSVDEFGVQDCFAGPNVLTAAVPDCPVPEIMRDDGLQSPFECVAQVKRRLRVFLFVDPLHGFDPQGRHLVSFGEVEDGLVACDVEPIRIPEAGGHAGGGRSPTGFRGRGSLNGHLVRLRCWNGFRRCRFIMMILGFIHQTLHSHRHRHGADEGHAPSNHI